MMRKVLFAALFLTVGAFYERSGRSQTAPTVQAEPTVRIGLNPNASTVNIRSSAAFTVQQNRTRMAKFSTVLALDAASTSRVLSRADLDYRMLVELDAGKVLVLPSKTKVRIEPTGTPIEIENRTYRGAIEVFGNSRNSFTVVNDLPLEEYLLGVVPNELSPGTYGQLEALKAQAVAARTYVLRNMGQYKSEGYDICATDACQVYFGAGTEDPLASRAVTETHAVIATYDDKPINALYSSTCGGRTENAENIFDERVPYLVSTICEYKHPQPLPFSSSRSFPDWKDAVLTVAGVSNYTEARRFMSIAGQGEPLKLLVNGQPREFKLSPDAPICQRIGDERLALRQGSWIGGELMEFRAVDDAIQMLVYRINFANPAADRYSRLALWQVHKTRRELDAALKAVNVGAIRDMRVIDRGPSERPVMTEIIGASGRRTVRALRLRTLLGLRDSLFSFDIERNAQGEVLGMMFYGRGWGHGVGMCQVGAYGMALEGATYEEILKKYYKGIELKKLY